MTQVFVRSVADMVDEAQGQDAYHWQWDPFERCCGRIRIVQDLVGSLGPVVECIDCGRRTQVVEGP